MTELAKITAPLLLRELILYVKNEAVVVPNTLAGGVGLAVFLLLLVLLQACTLQHFIHGGNARMLTYWHHIEAFVWVGTPLDSFERPGRIDVASLRSPSAPTFLLPHASLVSAPPAPRLQ